MKKTIAAMILIIAMAVIIPFPDNTNTEQASYSKTIDGDTIEVNTEKGKERVRLIGIDCPEIETQEGKEAKEYTQSLTRGQMLTLEKDVSERDGYGRLLRYVYLEDGTMLNEKLIEKGYATELCLEPDKKYQEKFKGGAS